MPTLMRLYVFKREGERERAKRRVRKQKSVNLGGPVMNLEEPEEWMNTTKNTLCTILKVLIIILLKISRK